MANKPYPTPANLSEQLVNLVWRLATEMRALYNTVKTKVSKTDADAAYLGKTAKAVSAKTADVATKATQDGNGKVIANTYALKNAIPVNMTGASASAAGKAGLVPAPAAGAQAKFLRGDGTWQTALTSQTQADWNATSGVAAIKNKPTIPSKTSELINNSNFVTTGAIPTKVSQLTNDSGYLTTQVRADWNATKGYGVINNKPTIPDVSTKINRSGDRGWVGGYETLDEWSSTSGTITPDSPDSILVSASNTGKISITFSGNKLGKFSVKTIYCYGSTSGIILNGVNVWAGDNTAPTIKKNAIVVVAFITSNVVFANIVTTWGD